MCPLNAPKGLAWILTLPFNLVGYPIDVGGFYEGGIVISVDIY